LYRAQKYKVFMFSLYPVMLLLKIFLIIHYFRLELC